MEVRRQKNTKYRVRNTVNRYFVHVPDNKKLSKSIIIFTNFFSKLCYNSRMDELQALAKERSVLQTKTIFRLIACAYLVYEGYFRMIRGHLADPESFPKAALFFGAVFLCGSAAYAVHAVRIYAKESRKQKERLAEIQQGKEGEGHGTENVTAGDDGTASDFVPGD